MTFFAWLLVFCFLVILYFQVSHQLRKGDEIEIYELDYTTNKALNDAAALKQPFIFRFSHIDPVLRKELSLERLATIYGGFDTTLQESLPYESDHPISHDSLILTMPPPPMMPAKTVMQMLRTDTSSRYFSNHNYEFCLETGLAKRFQEFDSLLRPPLCVHTTYDVWCGSAGAHTPLQYHMYERRFLYVTQGHITVKMTPWRSIKYMASYKDHAQFGFVSPLNVWSPQDEYLGGYEKMRFLEFQLEAGQMLFLPPFWHYSLRFQSAASNSSNNNDSCVAIFNYSSPANLLIQAPYWAHSVVTNYTRNSQTVQLQERQTFSAATHDTSPTDHAQNHQDKGKHEDRLDNEDADGGDDVKSDNPKDSGVVASPVLRMEDMVDMTLSHN